MTKEDKKQSIAFVIAVFVLLWGDYGASVHWHWDWFTSVVLAIPSAMAAGFIIWKIMTKKYED